MGPAARLNSKGPSAPSLQAVGVLKGPYAERRPGLHLLDASLYPQPPVLQGLGFARPGTTRAISGNC